MCRLAQIPVAISPRLLNYVRRPLIFVDSHYGTYIMSPFCALSVEKIVLPCIEYVHAGVHKYRATGRLGDYMCGGNLIFVGPQYTTCLESPFWHPEFLGCSWVFENFAPR